ncbi:hypothetical protein PINS_up005967 [Pythium insidiosum]|nr:hypothetical protein PINS_up005967 [Pythium insidiosum]
MGSGMRAREKLGVPDAQLAKFDRSWVTKFMRRTDRITHTRNYSVSLARLGDSTPRGTCQDDGADANAPFDLQPFRHFQFRQHCTTVSEPSTPSRRPTWKFEGVKLDKSRVTVGVAANADGTERLPVLIIGSANVVVPFRPQQHQIHWVGNKNRQPADPLHYSYSAKASMNSQIFESWLMQLDQRMAAENRAIVLILDNVNSHKVTGIRLNNVRIAFYPRTPLLSSSRWTWAL